MAEMNGGSEPPKIVASQYCLLVDGVEMPLEEYIEILVANGDSLKPAIEACIEAGLVPAEGPATGGIIWEAIKKCISGSPVVIPGITDADAAAAAAGQNPGTLIINVGNGTAANPDYVWYVNADGTVTNIESPAGPFVDDTGAAVTGSPIKIPRCVKVIPATSTTTELADAQTAADAAGAGQPPGTLVKVVESDACVTIFEVAADGTLCLQERPHRHIYARAAKNIKYAFDSTEATGLKPQTDVCVDITLECEQDLRISGGYSFRNGTLFTNGGGVEGGDWNYETEVNTFSQPVLDGAVVSVPSVIVSAMQGLDRGEEEQVPFDFILQGVSAGTHTICIRLGLAKNTLDGGEVELANINQVEFTVGSVHK